jgi:hypothetical protein
VLQVWRNTWIVPKQRLNLSDRNAMFLALRSIAVIPIESAEA